MSEKIQIDNSGTWAEVAQYKSQVIPEYRDNPLIEALPMISSRQEVIQALASYPPFDQTERYLDGQYRFHVIQRVFNFFQVLPIHLDLESRISRLIRQGYLKRNPFCAENTRRINQMDWELMVGTNFSSSYFNPSGLSIIGVSGIGKSSVLVKILQMMPQVICHSVYQGKPFNQYQVVWLKLDCSFDASVRGLINNFFVEIDKLLGTNYFDRFGKNRRLSANTLLPIVAKIVNNCSLGVLVVDEIQNLSLLKSGGTEQMLNFFVSLSNAIGVPLVLVGTPKALSLFSEFRQARRGSGQGDLLWEPMKKNDQNWRLFIEGIWDFQWVHKTTPLTDDLNQAMYEESCGITDIAVKLFAMSQIRAITSGREELSPQIIRSVAKENLKLVQPMLNALRSGNPAKIAKYGDISTVNIDGFISVEQSKLDLGSLIQSFKKQQQETREQSDKIMQDAVVRLSLLGLNEKEAKKLVTELLSRNSQLNDEQVFIAY